MQTPHVIAGRFNRPEPHWHQCMPSVTHARLAAAVLALETDCTFYVQGEGVSIWYNQNKDIQRILKSLCDLSIPEAAVALRNMRPSYVGGSC